MVNSTTTPFEDSGRATQPDDTGRASQREDSEGNTRFKESALSQKLPRHLPSLEIRQTPYPSDPLLLDTPPPVPYVPSKHSGENSNLN